ncbi:bifunctional phosphoribosylaminoimidazolecarboxamide formyltransferase/IMP cyclohydrolase [Thermosipho ferrireducens]|uniref:Bifunctional purine biosynthesis protein PurH n=1 Tax=Thermosipho ferrireducens TaxID=2571116 RepID=A0ABX7S8W3_9BACT|nr:bifunctional phosphoribosylaminoimidazolecarboxamide formyltransferase/IMP cyclohydrolase [Thermosipho ferrireducens]QTA38301.1 bifunctional phosphoribosylaminoimidazolecarboxamide formyltransferase/IMP cyclohydrolase [Thermosipho ferrireducens]
MKRALISVFDKSNVEFLAAALVENDFEIISTGNTAKYLLKKGINVIDIEKITNFPEILDGRVKTLHPKVHGGILARDTMEDKEILEKLNIKKIDLVYVNLYPFEEKLKEGLKIKDLIEYIDIGGPTLIRAAAKNFENTIVLVDPGDIKLVMEKIKKGFIDYETRLYLAAKAFNLTAYYDSLISNYFNRLSKNYFPEYFTPSLKRKKELRYGENPHQRAVFYENSFEEGFFNTFEQLNGKELSYNNFKDIDVAWKIVNEFDDEMVCCAVKHQTPCGVAIGTNNLEAFKKAYECDPVSIFGGIVAFNHKVTAQTASEMKKIFLEVIIAPDFEDEALEILSKKKNLRIIKASKKPEDKLEFSTVDGGVLVQERDVELFENLKLVTGEKVSDSLMEELIFAFKVVKHAKSNAIVVSKDKAAKGIGSGQPNRIWAAIDALDRAKDGVVLASDAFFPFDDVVRKAGEYKIKAIIQPGGSIRDNDSIKAAEELGIAMVFTGMRHFKH